MKYILLFVIIVSFFGCRHELEPGKKAITEVLTADEIKQIEAAINSDLAARGKKKTVTQVVAVDVVRPILTHNSGNSFTIDYNGLTEIVWMFFRWGSELNSVGGVDPYSAGSASQSFYLNPVTSFTTNGSSTYYQSIVVTGSTAPDENGVVGVDWVAHYSNTVQ